MTALQIPRAAVVLIMEYPLCTPRLAAKEIWEAVDLCARQVRNESLFNQPLVQCQGVRQLYGCYREAIRTVRLLPVSVRL